MFSWLVLLVAVLTISPLASAAGVDQADLDHAAADRAAWLMYGRTYDNRRYVPLNQITPENVQRLRPVWALSTGGEFAGLEGTPLLHDGTLYITADYARVFAVNARTGVVKWRYQPTYPANIESRMCCGPVNRGAALFGDRLFVSTLDARLVALNKDTGEVVWQQRFGDWQNGHTSNAAPLVVRGKVLVGIGGGEFGVRGYIKAFDAVNGKALWTTYTVPAPGEPGNETWPGDTWKTGGAATWITGSYDPELDLVLWGTGNPSPWHPDARPGDNLWSNSLLALDPDDGTILWGFQYTPNDGWDYDGNNAPVLADIRYEGRDVNAAIQANRNGFLYVIDRSNGKFVYARPTVEGINWTTGLNPETGRPIIDPDRRPRSEATVQGIVPALEGGTNWFPIAYNSDLKYVFVNSNQQAMSMTAWPLDEVRYHPGYAYLGADFQVYQSHEHIGRTLAFNVDKGLLVWETRNPLPLYAGLLATAGGLVFTGDQRGYLLAMHAETGEVLWRFQTGSGINASPISYELDGVQYVAVLSGIGGVPRFYFQGPRGGMLYVFALDGGPLIDAENWSQDEVEGALKRLDIEQK
jgi:alcohol dehydrogenase (cytochrome c)